MTDLSQDQVEKRASIQKSATIWGVIVGAVVGLIALWILGGQGGAVRYGGAVVAALAVGGFVYRASFKSGAKSALCEKCGAAFSRSRSGSEETLAGSEAKEERKEQPDGSTEVKRWTEEVYDVVDSYTCAKCGDVTTNAYQSTRRKDETTETIAAPEPETTKTGKSSASGSSGGKGAAKGSSGRGKGSRS